MAKTNRLATILAVCGATCGLTGLATASLDGVENNAGVISISGATLFFDFFESPASTRDFIDFDGDGKDLTNTPPFDPDLQLCQPFTAGIDAGSWIVMYRSTGSGNGFGEFVDFSIEPDTTPDDANEDPQFGLSSDIENALICGDFYITLEGGLQIIGNENHPGGAPVTSIVDPNQDGVVGDPGDLADDRFNRATIDNIPTTDCCEPNGGAGCNNLACEDAVCAIDMTCCDTEWDQDCADLAFTECDPDVCCPSGLFVSISTTDVPTAWFVTIDGEGNPFATPAQVGYGNNETVSNEVPTSDAGAGQSNKLQPLAGIFGIELNLFDPGNPDNADEFTIFDTPVAFSPICTISNYGTGLTQLTYTDQQHSLLTGRFTDGRNFIQITRDSGSGTRNGFNNGVCIDPSWGRGDNVGLKDTDPDRNRAGAKYQPSNKGGSGTLEQTTENTRLGIAYTGAQRGLSRWLGDGELEILAIQNDFNGSENAEFVRPTIQAILFNENPDDSFLIGAVQTFGTIGEPDAEAVEDGGQGLDLPRVRNQFAAGYLNNISRSIEAFEDTGQVEPGSPGEFLGFNFILTAATDFMQATNLPCTFIPNPVDEATKLQLQGVLNTPEQLLNNPAYASFGTVSINGIVPARLLGATYDDGVAGGSNFIDQNGNAVFYNDRLSDDEFTPDRNQIVFDFDGDGERDIDFEVAGGNALDDSDIFQAIRAWNERQGDGTPWTLSNNGDAVIEILGDVDMDGNFRKSDIRYWADGLAFDGEKVDRKLGFTLVDQAWMEFNGGGGVEVMNGFFNTMLSNENAAYDAGDARADVAGSGFSAPGAAPVGADMMVDIQDLEYVQDNFGDWADPFDAVDMDFSADMNGDLVVDNLDVCEILTILETGFGDLDLDGMVSTDEMNTLAANAAAGLTPADWSDGDFNNDNVVDAMDEMIAAGEIDPCNPAPPVECDGDINGDGDTTSADLNILLGNFGMTVEPGTGGDFDGSGTVDSGDLNVLLGDFGCVAG